MNQNTQSHSSLKLFSFFSIGMALYAAIQFSLDYIKNPSEFVIDFQLYYSSVQFFAQQKWEMIYNTPIVQDYINGKTSYFHPFINPPWALILLYPLQLLPFEIALISNYIFGQVYFWVRFMQLADIYSDPHHYF